MDRFVLGPDGKPCIWPFPNECTWTGDRYPLRGALVIGVDDGLAGAARVFTDDMVGHREVRPTSRGADADVVVAWKLDADLGPEGYELRIGPRGARIEAAGPWGAAHGAHVLAQLVRNAPDASLPGVEIRDAPAKPFRALRVPIPAPESCPWFVRLLDLAARYRFNTVVLSGWETATPGVVEEVVRHASSEYLAVLPEVAVTSGGTSPGIGDLERVLEVCRAQAVMIRCANALEAVAIHGWLTERHVRMAVSSDLLGGKDLPRDVLVVAGDQVAEDEFLRCGFETVTASCSGPVEGWEAWGANPKALGACVSFATGSGEAMRTGENKLYALLKTACLLWWSGYRRDPGARGCMLPAALESVVARLFPHERDRLEGWSPPSHGRARTWPVDLRHHYNAPLARSYWRVDDYYMTHLADARVLPGAAPFSLFQGVHDLKRGHCLCVADGVSGEIRGIGVGGACASIMFLHASVVGKLASVRGTDALEGCVVGCYRVHFEDGTTGIADIVYGVTIGYWKNFHGTNRGPYFADPVLSGVTAQGLPYRVYAQEWANPAPGKSVASVDVVPSSDLDVGIVLFGITVIG
jgi:hypothetical protein